MFRAGDRVVVPSQGIVGTVTRVDPRCAGGAPCPCCGRGVGVQPDGNPNVGYGVAPAECVLLAPGPAVLTRGGAA
ncbi:hypothetical protein [Sorangium sp. So ce388]|uniref:hypothetical protein n=1 Tax=Sorangium sp. So ce388 TaxID=3133309 RepID=UPI003F5B4FB3